MKKSARKRPVLVLGNDRSATFSRTLRDAHLSPTFLKSLDAVVHALRHSQVTAILVDRNQRRVDELELVLNVRDMNGEIPIILIGRSPDKRADPILSAQPATFLIDEAIDDSMLGAELKTLSGEFRS